VTPIRRAPSSSPWLRLLTLAGHALALLAGVVTLQCSGDEESGNSEAERPNILVIMADDMNPGLLEFMPIVQEEVVAKGTNYTNAFATTPTCCPGRASFLTGQYAHNHGVLNNRPPDGGYEAFDDDETLATWLQDEGYRTGLFGKYFNGYATTDIPPGWDRWRGGITDPDALGYYGFTVNHQGELRELEDVYSTDWFGDEAESFIEQEGGDAPLFVFYTPWAPHAPPEPAERHDDTCREPGPNGVVINEEDVADKPAWVRELTPLDLEALRRFHNRQICTLKALDESVGDLLNSLGSELENTLVVFTSDNGHANGEHRWRGKECFYQSCTRIPLVVRGPGFAAGAVIDDFVLNIDLAPTILGAAGLPIPESVDGEDIADGSRREDFLLEIWRAEDDGRSGVAVMSRRWLYTELDTGELELYDLQHDPDELNNLAESVAYSEVIAELHERLVALMEE
jgi:N-acetylglucosamine-6-sulfatase